MLNSNYEILKFVDGDLQLDVKTDYSNETVWMSAEEMALLFDVQRPAIVKHINNILKDSELDQSTCSNLEQVHMEGNRAVKRNIKIYNLDMIISVGYRVKSKRGIQFRKWANAVLKEYLIKGYAVNERKLDALNKTVKIQNRMISSVLEIDEQELVDVVSEYTKALDLLDSYDHQSVEKPKGNPCIYVLTYRECRDAIDEMKFSGLSDVFGVEKEYGKLEGILAAVYQNVFGKEVYSTIEDKAAHLLYFLVKDHPFVDGCKRIAAMLFLKFLEKNHALIYDGKLVISNDALVAITLLTAESKPEEMDVITNVIMNLLSV